MTDEQPQAAPGITDSLTFSFGDPASELYGVARAGLSVGDDGAPQASGLGLLFAGAEPVSARAAGGLAVPSLSWDAIDAGGVTTSVVEPLCAWRVAFTAEDGRSGFDLEFEAMGEPAVLDASSVVAELGGMEGYEQVCRVTGTVRARGGDRSVSCFGQRGHSWGQPDWERLSLVRTVSAWVDDSLAVSVSALRDIKAKHHDEEALSAVVFGAEGVRAVEEARVSTTYDEEGRQRRATLELYEDAEGFGRRLTGEVQCGTTLDLGRLRLDCAFFHWVVDGRHGVGRYDILRRT